MRIVTFRHREQPELQLGAMLPEDRIIDLFHEACAIARPSEHLQCFDLDQPTLAAAAALTRRCQDDGSQLDELRRAGAVLRRQDIRLLAPVPRPGKVICIGLNYRDHAEESGMDIPERPLLFSKFASCITSPGAPVRVPSGSSETDYEAELAVVIGRLASQVSKERAMEHVLGYANFNDVSARDFQFADGQWQRGKSCDTFAPFGEYIATCDEIPDPHKLRIRLRLNGETLQDSNTDQLIFGVPELVSAISESITLEPGDVIATGTPPGVGFARKPPIYLKDGDRMEVEIEGLGVLDNPVVSFEP